MKRQGSRHPHFESFRNQYYSSRHLNDDEVRELDDGEGPQKGVKPAPPSHSLTRSSAVESAPDSPLQDLNALEAHEVRLPARHRAHIPARDGVFRKSSAARERNNGEGDDTASEHEDEEEREEDSDTEGGGQATAVRRKVLPARDRSSPAAVGGGTVDSSALHRLPPRSLQHKPSLDASELQQGRTRARAKLTPFRKTSLPASMFSSQQRRRDPSGHRQPLLERTIQQEASRWAQRHPSQQQPHDEAHDEEHHFADPTEAENEDDGYYEFELRNRSGMHVRSPASSRGGIPTRSQQRAPSPSSRRPSMTASRRPSTNPSMFDPLATTEVYTANRIPQPRKYQDINPEAPDELPPSKPAPLVLLKPKRKRRTNFLNRVLGWFWKVMTWRFTKTMWPLAPSILLLILAGTLAAVFNLAYDVDWEGTRSWRWMVWAGAVIAVFVASNYLFAIIMWILKRLIFETKIFYYINTVTTTLSCFASSIVLLATSGTILQGWNSTPRWWINKILTSMLVVSILYFFVILGTKFLIVKLHREQFWESISKFLISERIIWKMAYGVRRKESVKRSHVLRKPSMHRFQNAWQWMLDKRANPYLDVTSYDVDDVDRAEPPLEHSASIARVILKNLDTYGKGYLEEEDFDRFFDYEDDVQAALRLFPRGQTIDLALITEAVHRVHKDRKSLYKTLFDRENAGKVLTYIINVIFALIMIFVIIIIFEVSITEYLIPLASFFLGFSFIFGASLKNLWEGVVLIFAVRPFDIGDRITIPGTTYPTLIVSKIGLFTTTFFATDGRCFIIPNQQLYALPITQYKRSKNYAVNVSVHLDFRTPAEKILMLREKVYEWMKQDNAPWLIRTDEDWMFWVDAIENNNKITVVFWIELQDVNWQRPRFYLVPKSNLYLAIQQACEELDITYHLPDQPVLLKMAKEDGPSMSSSSTAAAAEQQRFNAETSEKLGHEKLAQMFPPS